MPFTNTCTEDRGQQADRLISLTASSQLFHHLITTMRAPHVLKAHIYVQGFIWACAALGISLLIPPPHQHARSHPLVIKWFRKQEQTLK